MLVVELGCKFANICELIDYNFEIIGGAACTHRHSDHLNPTTLKEFLRRGVTVFAHEEVIKESNLSGLTPLLSAKHNKVGQFSIQTFEAPHNVPNYGFLITTPTKERILFVTDTSGVSLRFKNIDCIMVECNHDDDTLIDNLVNAEMGRSHPEYHMGLETCCEFCKENISASTKQIILIHLSQTNINEQHAIDTIKEYTHFNNVAVAHKGDKFIIENDDF